MTGRKKGIYSIYFKTGKFTIRGMQFGVDFIPRGASNGDNHILVRLISEDDDNWFEVDSFSSFWIDDLIETLQEAKSVLKTQEPDMYNNIQCGWRFK